MKRCKRLLGLLAALVLAAALCVPARAADESDWDGAKEALLAGLSAREDEIVLTGYALPRTEFKEWYFALLEEQTDLFYVEMAYEYTYSLTTDQVKILRPTYNMTKEEVDACAEQYQAALQRALHVVNDQMTDLEKALALHDYLLLHCEYDTSLKRHSAYEALVEGRAVCEGYTAAYGDLLTLCGIENTVARSDTMDHAWNLVKLNGQWYHVDVTWDDALPSTEGQALHWYFLLSDAAVATVRGSGTKTHTDWQAAYACTDTTYDAGSFWYATEAAVWFDAQNGVCYYLSGAQGGDTVTLYRRSGGDGAAEALAAVKTGQWIANRTSSADGSTTTTIQLTAAWYLWKYGDALVFNGPDAVYCYSLADGSLTTLQEWAEDESYTHVYGLWMEENAVYVRREPAAGGTGADELAYTFAQKLSIHCYDAGTVTPPTCTAGGYTTYTCTKCSDSYTADETSALGHSDRLGVCTVCGRVDPAFVLAPGDLNGDGSVTVEDALILANALAEKYALNAPQQQAAALDDLEGITVTDLIQLMRMVVGAAA